ncbi:hypothetical protein TIFTF001_041161 [Ficus carica]|uniref:Uncharacterized protein n=1 Tax=Ficus carica TaxID=3494 RepID=A0AA87Z2M1_FICCA|nr:hypothetical protein TIFTF001_041161 [Ficus carica]
MDSDEEFGTDDSVETNDITTTHDLIEEIDDLDESDETRSSSQSVAFTVQAIGQAWISKLPKVRTRGRSTSDASSDAAVGLYSPPPPPTPPRSSGIGRKAPPWRIVTTAASCPTCQFPVHSSSTALFTGSTVLRHASNNNTCSP